MKDPRLRKDDGLKIGDDVFLISKDPRIFTFRHSRVGGNLFKGVESLKDPCLRKDDGDGE